MTKKKDATAIKKSIRIQVIEFINNSKLDQWTMKDLADIGSSKSISVALRELCEGIDPFLHVYAKKKNANGSPLNIYKRGAHPDGEIITYKQKSVKRVDAHEESQNTSGLRSVFPYLFNAPSKGDVFSIY
jgi:hypothetical protein